MTYAIRLYKAMGQTIQGQVVPVEKASKQRRETCLIDLIQAASSRLAGPVCSVQVFWDTPQTGKYSPKWALFDPPREINRRSQEFL